MKCPHIITKGCGDESLDFCELTERPSGRIQVCLKVTGLECEIYNEILKELEDEGRTG